MGWKIRYLLSQHLDTWIPILYLSTFCKFVDTLTIKAFKEFRSDVIWPRDQSRSQGSVGWSVKTLGKLRGKLVASAVQGIRSNTGTDPRQQVWETDLGLESEMEEKPKDWRIYILLDPSPNKHATLCRDYEATAIRREPRYPEYQRENTAVRTGRTGYTWLAACYIWRMVYPRRSRMALTQTSAKPLFRNKRDVLLRT